MIDCTDARNILQRLVGQTVFTIDRRKPNYILTIEGANVIVGTDASPNGKQVPIAEVQAALDTLCRDGHVQIDVKIIGYRSSFIGAVLATLPGAEVATEPRSVKLAP